MPTEPRPPRVWRHGLLALAVAALSVTITTPAATAAGHQAASASPLSATAAQVTANHASQSANTASGVTQVDVPGLVGTDYTVTLPTGDQIRLTGSNGHYVAALQQNPGASPVVTMHAQADADGNTTDIVAQPVNAIGLLRSGLVDSRLFDVTWLAAHGDTGPAAQLPISISYAGAQTAATLQAKAAALPGATVTATVGDTLSVTVPASGASAFWNALTASAGTNADTPAWAAKAQLVGGATRVWLTGDPSVVAPASTPVSVVTVIEKRTEGPAFLCNALLITLCSAGPVLSDVGGTAAAFSFPVSASCLDQNPCTTVAWVYDVPSGTYTADDLGAFRLDDSRMIVLDLVDPQFTVAGDTTITLNGDSLVPVTVATPRPTDTNNPYDAVIEDTRTLANGTRTSSFDLSAYGYSMYEATPTSTPVTVGSYHMSTVWTLGQAPLTMSVNSPTRLALHPIYPSYTNIVPNTGFTRFQGRQTLQLVYAGYGSAADFAGIDARGKLALIRTDSGDNFIQLDQLQDAIDAGAAGVLIDPTDYANPALQPTLPVYPAWFGGVDPDPPLNIPFAAVPSSDAAQLNRLLAAGPVSITVTDNGPSTYQYDLKFNQESTIPAALHYTVVARQLSAVNAGYHAGGPTAIMESHAEWLPDEFAVGGSEDAVMAPAAETDYYGPITPDTIWQRLAGPMVAQFFSEMAFNVFDHATSGSEQWFDEPAAPGAVTPQTDVFQAQPGNYDRRTSNANICSFCRSGNYLYPFATFTAGSTGATPRLAWGSGVYTDMHLYQQDGTEIPLTRVDGLPAYPLPAQQATYRLTTNGNGIASDWTFSSAEPTINDAPAGYDCFGTFLFDDPCHADPLIFLRYDAHTSLTDSVDADRQQLIDITPYLQQNPAGIAALTSFKVWTSVDGGTTWTQATAHKNPDGSYTAAYHVPALSATDGFVSVKVQAADAGGDTVTQTLTDSYSLTSG